MRLKLAKSSISLALAFVMTFMGVCAYAEEIETQKDEEIITEEDISESEIINEEDEEEITDSNGVAVESVEPEVQLNTSSLTIAKNTSKTLTVTAKDETGKTDTNPDLTWSSSDENVATVEDGMVTGVTEGEATITVTYKGKSAECKVTVIDGYGLKNPRRDKSGTVTWDCVYFGSYPQAEVVADKSTYTSVMSKYLSEGDIIESSGLYSMLKSASFNSNNLATVTYSGSTYTYKRIKKGDATYGASGDSNYYNWSDSTTWHYFRCEPIKWRVLSVNGSDAFLLAEKGLDDQEYNTSFTSITWEKSTIRSWLNGYGSTVNTEGTDYSSNGDNFIDTAFTSVEKATIKTTSVVNADNTHLGIDGGNDTSDKVFLLSESEVYSTSNGFSADYGIYDKCRRSKSSTYAKAMGAGWSFFDDDIGNCWWWLRSPGSYTAAYVRTDGSVSRYGCSVDDYTSAARPALHINLSSNLHTLAGTVNSGGGTVTIATYQKVKLSPSDFGTTESIAKYTLSSKKLASINSRGELKAKKPGDVTVIAYKKNENGKYETVGEPLTFHIEKPVLNKTTLYKADETVSANSVILSGTSLTPIKWTSSKSSVVTVDENSGKITAVKSGTAKITAYFGEGSNAAKYTTKVTVKIPRLSSSKVTLKAGKTKRLKIKNTSLPVFEWKSSDESVATVDKYGLVIAVSAGSADISATVDGVDYTCAITVKALPANKHLLWFDANGGYVRSRNKVVTTGHKYGKLPKPTWQGHTFSGWYTDQAGGTPVTASDLAGSSDCTIYAVWDL